MSADKVPLMTVHTVNKIMNSDPRRNACILIDRETCDALEALEAGRSQCVIVPTRAQLNAALLEGGGSVRYGIAGQERLAITSEIIQALESLGIKIREDGE